MIKTALSNMVDTSHITTEHLKNRTTEGNKFKLWYSFQLPGKKNIRNNYGMGIFPQEYISWNLNSDEVLPMTTTE